MPASVIQKYFLSLTALQLQQFEAMGKLYTEWNAKINVISRKDIENLYVHHILHSLAIARYISFLPGTSIIDVGTGGGFPGIPLAVFFPEVNFLLLDSIRKKTLVAQEVAQALNLHNVEVIHSRIEDEKRKFDFVISRAVMPLLNLVKVSRKNITDKQQNSLPNGIICLKGGDLTAEIHPFAKTVELYDLENYFDEPFFDTKQIVYLPVY